jgi:hypothetical protein
VLLKVCCINDINHINLVPNEKETTYVLYLYYIPKVRRRIVNDLLSITQPELQATRV